jgi:hypothetical protein
MNGTIVSVDTSKHLTADSFREKVTHTSAGDVKITKNWGHVIAEEVAAAILGAAIAGPASGGIEAIESAATRELEKQLAQKAQAALRWKQAVAQAEKIQAQVAERYGFAQGSEAMRTATGMAGRSSGGLGNISQPGALTSDEALSAGLKWLGKGYRELGKPGSGVFRSADGLRQFKMTPSDLLGTHWQGPHVSFEALDSSGVVTENLHILLKP